MLEKRYSKVQLKAKRYKPWSFGETLDKISTLDFDK
jgi:hypothetical protein